jgi:hypothetical protein
MSLLSQAKAIKISRAGRKPNKVTKEQSDLAIAWLKGDVRVCQIHKSLGLSPGNHIYVKLGIWIQDSYRRGKITVK